MAHSTCPARLGIAGGASPHYVDELALYNRALTLPEVQAIHQAGSAGKWCLEFSCDGLDDNANGVVDENCDDDGDGYCDPALLIAGNPPVCPQGGGDCDDTSASCTTDCSDNDLDGLRGCDADCDDTLATCTTSCLDLDGDGLAVCAGDCDDTRGDVFPLAPQLCDGVNNDCSDPTWPVPPATEVDDDNDWVLVCAGDCDDTNAAINPHREEICNGIDDDCNTLIDDHGGAEDPDTDGVAGACDNCPESANPGQADTDLDLVGDACDNCVVDINTDQFDSDGDQQGNRCDIDDGLITLYFEVPEWIDWDEEVGFTAWNLYGGDLATLRSSGVYTQSPGANPSAFQSCGVANPFALDPVVPDAGEVTFYLATGMVGAVEGDLGTDSSGTPRPNDNPCP